MRKALTILTALVAIFTLTTVSAVARPSGNDGKNCTKAHAYSLGWFGGGKAAGDTSKGSLTVRALDFGHDTQKYSLKWKMLSKKYVMCKIYILYGADLQHRKNLKTGKYSGKTTYVSNRDGEFAVNMYFRKR